MSKSKIFITTGSVLEFASLIKVMDDINKNNKYDIIAQIGKDNYKPKKIKFFKFADDLNKYYDWADLIITHTGIGTILELCQKQKKAIAISNPRGYKDIYEIAAHFDKLDYLLYIPFENIEKNSKLLETKIDQILSSKRKFKKYVKENNTIGKEIFKFLKIKED